MEKLQSFYEAFDNIISRGENEEAARREEAFMRAQAEPAEKNRNTASQYFSDALDDIFGKYDLTDKYGNTYVYDPVKATITAEDGSVVSVSSGEARRRALEHMYNIGLRNL